MSDARIREKQLDQLKRELEPVRTADMSGSPQTTTNSYALVSESKVQPAGREYLQYIVEEVGGSNAVDAWIVKRSKDDAGNWSSWVPDGGANASTTGLSSNSATKLEPADTRADQYGVEIKANSNGSQGDVDVKGAARSASI